MIIDAIIIGFLCLHSAKGFKKGMLVSLFSILCFFLSFYLTYLLLPSFVDIINKIFELDINQGLYVKDVAILNDFVNSNSKLLLVIKFFLHINQNSLNSSVASFVVNVTSFVILAIFIKGCLKIIAKKLSTNLKKFFDVGSFDRFCGLFLGFFKGVMIVSIFSFVILSLMEFEGINQILQHQIESSSLVNVFNSGAIIIVNVMGYNLF